MTDSSRAEFTEQLADGDPSLKAHLDELSDEQFARFVGVAIQIASGELRRVEEDP